MHFLCLLPSLPLPWLDERRRDVDRENSLIYPENRDKDRVHGGTRSGGKS